jgi:drug/metabolite transporter (DMT)-like permease
MFFVFAIISMAAYALHSVWMAPYYRRNEQLTVVTLRGVGMSLAMTPVLLIPDPAGVVGIGGQLPWILAASATALLGNWASANSLRHLPIGIATALNMSLSTLVSAWLSTQWLGESLSGGQIGWMGLVFLGVFGLGAVRSPPITSVTYSLPKGLMFASVFGLALGAGFTLITRVSRSLDPLVAGYCWESTIAVLGASVLLMRRLAFGRIGSIPSRRDFGWIILFCIPGAVGTACYALAVAGGPLAVVSAILGTMMVVSSILAWLMYGEKLSGGQWFFVAFVCCAVIGMRFSSG